MPDPKKFGEFPTGTLVDATVIPTETDGDTTQTTAALFAAFIASALPALQRDTIITTDIQTGVVGRRYQVDTAGGTVSSFLLPAAPAVGDWVQIEDATQTWNIYPLSIGRNALNINGAAANFVSSVMGAKLRATYISVGHGWSVK